MTTQYSAFYDVAAGDLAAHYWGLDEYLRAEGWAKWLAVPQASGQESVQDQVRRFARKPDGSFHRVGLMVWRDRGQPPPRVQGTNDMSLGAPVLSSGDNKLARINDDTEFVDAFVAFARANPFVHEYLFYPGGINGLIKPWVTMAEADYPVVVVNVVLARYRRLQLGLSTLNNAPELRLGIDVEGNPRLDVKSTKIRRVIRTQCEQWNIPIDDEPWPLVDVAKAHPRARCLNNVDAWWLATRPGAAPEADVQGRVWPFSTRDMSQPKNRAEVAAYGKRWGRVGCGVRASEVTVEALNAIPV